jgi:hypothetical protein
MAWATDPSPLASGTTFLLLSTLPHVRLFFREMRDGRVLQKIQGNTQRMRIFEEVKEDFREGYSYPKWWIKVPSELQNGHPFG